MTDKQNIKVAVYLSAFFLILVILVDWLYVMYIENRPNITINAWFVLFPIISPFYFVFGIISCVGILRRKKMGFNLAYIVILLGALSTSLSCLLAYKAYPILQLLFAPLIILNFLVMAYIGYFGAHNHLK